MAALGKVADAYAPYAPDPNDDDSDLNDDDPGNVDDDPLDDPRSYPDDDDDENDFSKAKISSMVMLLQKLEDEAE